MNNIGEKKYFKEIDLLKGIAILTVVLEHSFAVKYVDLSSISWCYHTVEIIKSFNMQLFFAISGFLFANSNTTNLSKAYRSKIDRLFVPMLFLSLINLCLEFGLPTYMNIEQEHTIGQSILNIFVYGESYWFIYTLFVIFIILLPLKEKLSPKIIIGALAALVFIREIKLVDCGVLQISQVLYMVVFFLLGYLLYLYYDVLRSVLSNSFVFTISLIIYIILYSFSQKLSLDCISNWFLPLLMGAFIWGAVIILSNAKPEFKWLKYLGKNSLQFYMFNGYALVPVRLLCVKIIGMENPFVIVSSVFCLSLVILFIMTEVSRRIPVLSYLCGFGRKK